MGYKRVDAPRILYIEDDKVLQMTTSIMLERLGYEVACVDNGKLGIEKAESWKPDVILMDLRLPVFSGDQAIYILRSKSTTSNIPIFVLSTFNDPKTRDLCQRAGANRFYTKPADIRKINTAIKQLLDKKEYVQAHPQKPIMSLPENFNFCQA